MQQTWKRWTVVVDRKLFVDVCSPGSFLRISACLQTFTDVYGRTLETFAEHLIVAEFINLTLRFQLVGVFRRSMPLMGLFTGCKCVPVCICTSVGTLTRVTARPRQRARDLCDALSVTSFSSMTQFVQQKWVRAGPTTSGPKVSPPQRLSGFLVHNRAPKKF